MSTQDIEWLVRMILKAINRGREEKAYTLARTLAHHVKK